MINFAVSLKDNIWPLLIAFFLARFAVRLSSFLLQGLENYFVFLSVALALQGFYFGIIFCLAKKKSVDLRLSAATAIAALVIGLPALYLLTTGQINPPWMLATLPATFFAFSLLAMIFTKDVKTIGV